MNKTTILFALAVFVCANAFPAVWYVDKDNVGTENGTSWATAFNTIQEGIDAAYAAAGGEVWVAEGTYNESRTSIVHPAPNDVNTGSVVLREGVDLYGGFIGIGPGGNETDRSQRDWTTHVTTIDGSTSRDGSRAYHVVVGAMGSTLDGIRVFGGAATGPDTVGYTNKAGGGLYNNAIVMTIRNTTLDGNDAYSGGGMYNRLASVIVDRCILSNNRVPYGVSGWGAESAIARLILPSAIASLLRT